jgi:hypothetical protein
MLMSNKWSSRIGYGLSGLGYANSFGYLQHDEPEGRGIGGTDRRLDRKPVVATRWRGKLPSG